MDPISVAALTAILTKVIDAAGEEAGGQLWRTLSSLVGKVFRRGGTEARTALEAVSEQPDDPARTRDLAEILAAEAQRNPAAATELRDWMAAATRTLRDDSVRNTIDGQVHGPVIQARDIHGDIRFG